MRTHGFSCPSLSGQLVALEFPSLVEFYGTPGWALLCTTSLGKRGSDLTLDLTNKHAVVPVQGHSSLLSLRHLLFNQVLSHLLQGPEHFLKDSIATCIATTQFYNL